MNPLLFGFLINRMRGQDNNTAARNAIIGHAVGGATAGIANPVARALATDILTHRLETGEPLSADRMRDIFVRSTLDHAMPGLADVVGSRSPSVPVTRPKPSPSLPEALAAVGDACREITHDWTRDKARVLGQNRLMDRSTDSSAVADALDEAHARGASRQDQDALVDIAHGLLPVFLSPKAKFIHPMFSSLWTDPQPV